MSKASRKERRKSLAAVRPAAPSTTNAGVPAVSAPSIDDSQTFLPAAPRRPARSEADLRAEIERRQEMSRKFNYPRSNAASQPASESQPEVPAAKPAHGGGPQTFEGKRVSSANAMKHGLTGFSLFVLLPGENPDEFLTLCTELKTQFGPVTHAETLKIEDMAQAWWLQRRARLLQTAALLEGDKAFALYLRYETTQRRTYQAAYKELQDLLKARQAAEAAAKATAEAAAAETAAKAGPPPNRKATPAPEALTSTLPPVSDAPPPTALDAAA